MDTYNGWTNYETWAVNLWLMNQEGSYFFWTAAAKGRTVAELADMLQESHTDNAPEWCGVYSDLLGRALNRVNWLEIAEAVKESAGA